MKNLRLVLFVVLAVAIASAVTFTALSRVAITNSKIDSTTVGATTPSTGVFTSVAATSGANHILSVCTFDPTGLSTGTGAMATIYNCSVPGNTILAGQALRITTNYTTGASVTACSSQFIFGGQVLAGASSVSLQNANTMVVVVKNNNANQTNQVAFSTDTGQSSFHSSSSVGGVNNTTLPTSVSFQMLCPGTVTTMQGQGMITEVIQ